MKTHLQHRKPNSAKPVAWHIVWLVATELWHASATTCGRPGYSSLYKNISGLQRSYFTQTAQRHHVTSNLKSVTACVTECGKSGIVSFSQKQELLFCITTGSTSNKCWQDTHQYCSINNSKAYYSNVDSWVTEHAPYRPLNLLRYLQISLWICKGILP